MLTLQEAYVRGLVDGITAYAYSSSAPWAENGVLYVGTTGTTLAEAIEDAKAGVYPPQPDMTRAAMEEDEPC